MKKKHPENGKIAAVEIQSLEQLQALANEPVVLECQLHGKPVKFVGRRLTPEESKGVKLWLEKALPPVIPGPKPEDEARYDFSDPGYRTVSEENRRMARALAVSAAFPIFKGPPGTQATEPVETIKQRVERLQIPDELLDALFNAIVAPSVKIGAHVNF